MSGISSEAPSKLKNVWAASKQANSRTTGAHVPWSCCSWFGKFTPSQGKVVKIATFVAAAQMMSYGGPVNGKQGRTRSPE